MKVSDWSNFVFNLVFCATTATIVSGAMAERTKFLSYFHLLRRNLRLDFTPIEANNWIWGGGWRTQIGFHETLLGSCAIHMVGGIGAPLSAQS